MEDETGYELTASVVLWRGEEMLVMKRAGGFSAGGWFMPGGHVEPGERPTEAAAREVLEETGIAIDPASLAIVDVMTYEAGGATAHSIIYNGACPDGAECVINEEHVYHRWITPEGYIARFLDAGTLRAKGAPERGIALATEVARVVRTAALAWQQQVDSARPRAHRSGDPIDEETVRRQHEAILRVVEQMRATRARILAERGGKPFTTEEIDDLLDSVVEDRLNRLIGIETPDDDSGSGVN